MLKKYYSIILYNYYLFIISALQTQSFNNITYWESFADYAKIWSKSFSTKNKPIFEELLKRSSNVSQNCSQSVFSTFEAIEKLENWSMEMINSWGNFPPAGLFEGSLTDLGSYDQCLAIKSNGLIGSSQYCSIDFIIPIPRPMPRHQNLYHKINNLLPIDFKNNTNNVLIKIANEASIFYWISLRIGICTPNKCTADDIHSLSKAVSAMLGLELKAVKCEIKANPPMDSVQIIALFLFMAFLLLCISATAYNSMFQCKKNSKSFVFVRLFSIHHSMNRLTSPTTSQDLSCVHGIRVLTILWIIYGHSISWSNYQIYGRSFRGKDLLTSFIAQPLINGEYGVVTFFLISGILTSYITLCVTKGDLNNFKITLFVILRLGRLLPQLLIFILLTFLVPLLGSGPIWREVVDPNVNNCYKNWWLNLLLIQNLYKSDEMCALHTWFIACDFQYHLITILLIIAFLYNFKLGFYLNIITVIIFLIISSSLIYIFDLPPAIINTARDEHYEKYFSNIYYISPASHGAVYFIGTLFGYLIYRRNTIKIQKISLLIVWVSILTGYCIPLWDKVFWNHGEEYTSMFSAFFHPFCRIIWSFCTSIMIWLCISGNGNIVNKILSLKIWVPLARLTYSVYLVHAWILWYFTGSRRHLIDTNMYDIYVVFLHHAIMSYLIGLAFFILFESPILEIQKYVIELLRQRYEERINVELKSLE